MQQYRKNLGKVSLTAEGSWDSSKQYDILSIVYDEHTQHGFISKKEVPSGVDLYNAEYWMPLNVSGFVDNNIIILSKKTSDASIQSYTLEEAVKSIPSVGRRPGAILGFYNLNTDRLDIGGRWELWQYNAIDVANWENLASWQNIYYNFNRFVGWYRNEEALKKYIPFPEIGCYGYVGSDLNDAVIYRCDRKYSWTNTTQHVWDYIKVTVDGNVTVGANGNWFNDGVDTNIPASIKGENGKTPVFRNNNNVIEVSYNNVDWTPISDEIAAWFRWQTSGGQQANSTGKIQISRDKVIWTDLSGEFVNNLRISRYIGANESLPTSDIAEGTIYAKGPTYADEDTSHSNPIYRLWVYAWKGNTLAWQDNGEFQSIAAGVVQETGDSETEVMSQKAVSEKVAAKIVPFFKMSYGHINFADGVKQSSENYATYTIINEGYTKIVTTVSNLDILDASIAYFTDDGIYMKSDSIQSKSGTNTYEAIIPTDCKTIIVTNRITSLANPSIKLYKYVANLASDIYNELRGDSYTDNRAIGDNYAELESAIHVLTDYIPCKKGDKIKVVFGTSEDYEHRSVLYDANKQPIRGYRNTGNGFREFEVDDEATSYIRCSILKIQDFASTCIFINGIIVWNATQSVKNSLDVTRINVANVAEKINNRFEELDDTGDILKCEHEKQAILSAFSQKTPQGASGATPEKFFVIAHITDTHNSVNNLKRAIKMLNSEDFSDVDVLIHGGDCGYDYKDEYGIKHQSIFANYNGKKPLLFAMGNHDCAGTANMGSDTIIDIKNFWFEYLYNASFNGLTIDKGKSYYYYDNDSYKIRLIVLDDYEWLYEGMQREFATGGDGSNVVYSQEQINWFINTLADTPENYTIIIAKHGYDNGVIWDNSEWTSPYRRGITQSGDRYHILRKSDGQKGRIIEDILNAYINKTTFAEQYTFDNELITSKVTDISINADFTSAKGIFAFMCFGHKHQDAIGIDSVNPAIKNILCAGSGTITAGNDNIGRTTAGKCVNLLNLYVVRTDVRRVYIIRIGADFTQEGVKKAYTYFDY